MFFIKRVLRGSTVYSYIAILCIMYFKGATERLAGSVHDRIIVNLLRRQIK